MNVFYERMMSRGIIKIQINEVFICELHKVSLRTFTALTEQQPV